MWKLLRAYLGLEPDRDGRVASCTKAVDSSLVCVWTELERLKAEVQRFKDVSHALTDQQSKQHKGS